MGGRACNTMKGTSPVISREVPFMIYIEILCVGKTLRFSLLPCKEGIILHGLVDLCAYGSNNILVLR